MTNLFDQVADQLDKQPDYYWQCRSRSFLIEILILIDQSWFIEDKNISLFSSGYSEDIEKIILHLYSNYADKITIPELVAKFNIDRTTLTNKFKEEVGDSVINSLIKLRINLASSLLRDTLIPISEITYRVGFTDISHFNRTFKKHTGFNPSQYRQTYNFLINS
jgi:AraC family L-rhamnose operon regulatory protein RhaS